MPEKRNPVTDELSNEVVDLYVNQGARLADITDKTGVPRSTIYWILQRAGVDANRQGTRRADPTDRQTIREAIQWAMSRVEELAVENATLRAENAELRTDLSAAVRGHSDTSG